MQNTGGKPDTLQSAKLWRGPRRKILAGPKSQNTGGAQIAKYWRGPKRKILAGPKAQNTGGAQSAKYWRNHNIQSTGLATSLNNQQNTAGPNVQNTAGAQSVKILVVRNTDFYTSENPIYFGPECQNTGGAQNSKYWVGPGHISKKNFPV